MRVRSSGVVAYGTLLVLMMKLGTAPEAWAQGGVQTVAGSEDYFPDALGSRWSYRGRVVEGTLQRVASREFVNVSTVKDAHIVKGVTVKVYHDTNPGNHGPMDSYYRKDAAGIVYYGSDPGTDLEREIVPYQIVRFPLEIPSSFQQFNRQDLNFGTDLDGDRQNERVDVSGTITVSGQESVSVPAGIYPDTVRIEAKMVMKIHLTNLSKTVVSTDIMTTWFAKGIGLVKYVERQEIPPWKSDEGFVSETTEELEKVTITTKVAQSSGANP